MNTARKTSLNKIVAAMLIVALLMAATIGSAFAAPRGDLSTAAGVLGEDPDPGPVPGFIYVYGIDFKIGSDVVFAATRVLDQSNHPVKGALVSAVWTFPEGSVMKLQGQTNSQGFVYFIVEKATGENKMEIEDVQLPGINFNASASQLSGTVNVGK